MRADQRRAADVELDLALVIRDHRPERHLAPGAGRRRDRDEGRDAVLDGVVIPLVVRDRAAVSRDDADRLGRVHRGAAAEADEPVATRLHVQPGAFVDERDVGIGPDLVEDGGVVEVLESPIGEAGRGDARIRHEQRARDSELAKRLAQPSDRPGAVHEPRRYFDGADDLDFHRHRDSLLSAGSGRDPAPVAAIARCLPGR